MAANTSNWDDQELVCNLGTGLFYFDRDAGPKDTRLNGFEWNSNY